MDVYNVTFACLQHDDQSEERSLERIWIIRVASEIAFQHLHPDTGGLAHSRGAQFALCH